MKLLISILLTAICGAVSGESFRSQVVEVVPGEYPSQKHMIKWANGRVTYASSEEARSLEKSSEKHDLGVQLDDKFNVIALQSYEPTILDSLESANKLLRTMRRPNPIQWNIQCYNMAHVRAYEAWKNHGVKSMKAFLFFTNSYIRRYGHKWWFHVTPMVYVKINGKVEERILDREWAKTAVTTKEWTDKFIKPKTPCPVIGRYSEYEDHQDAQNCYLLPVNMYYWQPLHLVELERSRNEMNEFNMSQVRTAYARDM